MDAQLKRGLVEVCILTLLTRGDSYGYQLIKDVEPILALSESTLYPVLRRLQKDGLCRTYDQPHQGRNRRYYSITGKGRQQLEDYRTQWNDYRTAIESLLYSEGEHLMITEGGTD